MIVPIIKPAHEGSARVLLTSVDVATGTELSGGVDVALVEIIAVVLGDVPDGDASGADRVGVRGGIVVLCHAPAGDFAVEVIQLLEGVVWLRDARGFHIMAEFDELVVAVGVEDDEGDVVSAVAAVFSERIEEMVLNDLFHSECLLVRVRAEDVVVTDPGEPRVFPEVVGEAVGGREEEIGGEDGGGAHEEGLAGAEEHEEAGHPGEGA